VAPLATAVNAGDAELVRLLLEHGAKADAEAGGMTDWRLLRPAVNQLRDPTRRSRALRIMELLREHGADPNRGGMLEDLLAFAVNGGWDDLYHYGPWCPPPVQVKDVQVPSIDAGVAVLLAHGASPNKEVQGYRDKTPFLNRAIEYGEKRSAELLVKAGASLAPAGVSPLTVALQKSDWASARSLPDAGAVPSGCHAELAIGNEDILTLVLSHGRCQRRTAGIPGEVGRGIE
jgi:ankyrin repeat protein